MRSARSPLELTPSCTIPLSFRSPLLFNQPDPGSNNSWILNPNPAIPDPRSRSNKSWIPILKILDPPSWPNELTLEPGQGSVPGAAADRGDNAKEWHQEENRLQNQLLTPSIPILTCNKLTRQEGRLWLENLCTYIWTSWTHSWFRKKTSRHMCGTPLDSWGRVNKNVSEHTGEAREHYLVKWTEATFFDSEERAYWPSVSCAGRGSYRFFGGVEDQQQKLLMLLERFSSTRCNCADADTLVSEWSSSSSISNFQQCDIVAPLWQLMLRKVDSVEWGNKRSSTSC